MDEWMEINLVLAETGDNKVTNFLNLKSPLAEWLFSSLNITSYCLPVPFLYFNWPPSISAVVAGVALNQAPPPPLNQYYRHYHHLCPAPHGFCSTPLWISKFTLWKMWCLIMWSLIMWSCFMHWNPLLASMVQSKGSEIKEHPWRW